MNLFVTVPLQGTAFDGTSKPKTDVVDFLRPLDFKTLGLLRYDWHKVGWDQARLRLAGALDQVRPEDVVVYQFPIYTGYRYEIECLDQLHARHARVIGLIHDVDYLRYGTQQNRAGILVALQKMDLLILTSKKMADFLRAEGCTTPAVIRGPWDYQSALEPTPKTFAKKVVVAGHLATTHTGFLAELSQRVDLDVYGFAYDDFVVPESVNYHGPLDPVALALELHQGFGLVWNSRGINDSTSNYFTYMAYTWLHKFSLFLSSDLPVIVKSQTPMADFVEKYHLGLVIDSLENLPESLDKCTEADYQTYCQQANFISGLMRRGFFTAETVICALQAL